MVSTMFETKREIWEEEQYEIDDSNDKITVPTLDVSMGLMDTTNEILKGELKAQES